MGEFVKFFFQCCCEDVDMVSGVDSVGSWWLIGGGGGGVEWIVFLSFSMAIAMAAADFSFCSCSSSFCLSSTSLVRIWFWIEPWRELGLL